MAHYAFLDKNNIVVEVIVGKDENEDGGNWEERYGAFRGLVCKRTSYNTINGQHLTGGTPFRKNYAGIGFFYDTQRDAFIPPKNFRFWVLDENTCNWTPPVLIPDDGKMYVWNDEIGQWDEVS